MSNGETGESGKVADHRRKSWIGIPGALRNAHRARRAYNEKSSSCAFSIARASRLIAASMSDFEHISITEWT